MPFPTIIYNATSGSDSLASGAGPATAVTGSSAAHTGGAASTTIQFNNTPDLSGVVADGSHALWMNVSGARRLSKIVGVDNTAKTVTVEDSFNIANTGGGRRDYAIGGKRATLNADTARRDWQDVKAGWTFQFEDGTYDTPVTIAPVVGDTTSGPVTFRAANGASPIIRTTANVRHFDALNMLRLIGLTATTSSGTKTATEFVRSNGATTPTTIIIKGCVIDGLQNGLNSFWGLGSIIVGNVFKNLVANGLYASSLGPAAGLIANNVFKDNGGWAIIVGVGCRLGLRNNIFHNNASGGVSVRADSELIIHGNIFDGNGGDGLDISTGAISVLAPSAIYDNIFTNNGGYGIDAGSSIALVLHDADYNAFYNNTSGPRNNIASGANDITLTADPYEDLASDNFNINNATGGGAALRSVTLSLPS